MGWTKRIKLIMIPAALLIILFAVFSMFKGESNTSSAPSVSGNEKNLVDGKNVDDSTVPGTSDPRGPNLTDFPESTYISPMESGFLTVKLETSDIFHGNLILVNYNHQYEIPDELGLIDIAELKTPSYMVAENVLMLSDLAIGPLNDMMDAFYSESGRDTVTVISAFRDYKRQKEIHDEYVVRVGQSEASKWAALPGYSEHHIGLAVDFGDFSSGTLRTFNNTGINEWFFLNAYQYGFIPRYPSEKTEITKIAYEPWHFSYVGQPHAAFIRDSGLCFEEYIEFLMGFTRNAPYTATFDNEKYEVYYTSDTVIPIPFGSEFEISGNNIDGFIVTLKY